MQKCGNAKIWLKFGIVYVKFTLVCDQNKKRQLFDILDTVKNAE